jgi:hypothetical protein
MPTIIRYFCYMELKKSLIFYERIRIKIPQNQLVIQFGQIDRHVQ